MEGFITFLLFFVLFMWLMKRLFPLLLVWFVKRRMKQGGNGGAGFAGPNGFGFWSTGFGNMENRGSGEQKKEEGKVVITDIPKQEKVIDKEIGEYVDFEER